MTVADTAAVKALVESASSALSGHTFITKAPDGAQPQPYVIVHPAEGDDEQTRLTGPYATTNPEFTLHIVNTSATAVQTLVGLIKAKFVLNGFPVAPIVAGRRNYNAYWHSPTPIQTDKDVVPWLTYAVVQLGWASDPA